MGINRKQRAGLLARSVGLLAAFAIAAAACGDDESAQDATPTTSESADATTAPPASATTAPPASATTAPPASATTAPTVEAPGPDADPLEVYEYFNSLRGEEREAALVAAAKAEGTFSIYGPTTTTEVFTNAFAEEYGIEIELYAADNEEIFQRFEQEQQAGQGNVDVLLTAAHNFGLFEKGTFGVYESEFRDSLPDQAKGEYWTGTGPQEFVVGYNTSLVDPAALPATVEGFADPAWDGRIAMEPGDYDWYAGLYTYWQDQGKTDEEIDAIFEGIAANAVPVKGHTGMATQLAAGGVDAIISGFMSSIERLAGEGAPIAWRGDGLPTVEPIVLRYSGAAVVANAPHPATALLFLDFLLKPESLALYEEAAALPPNPADFDGFAGLDVAILDPDEFTASQTEWSTRYDELVRSIG
jgi:iron(III) transport system substrate-binding protein